MHVSVFVTYQALQPLSHNRSKASFARQFRDKEDILWCCDLVGAVSATCVRVMKKKVQFAVYGSVVTMSSFTGS